MANHVTSDALRLMNKDYSTIQGALKRTSLINHGHDTLVPTLKSQAEVDQAHAMVKGIAMGINAIPRQDDDARFAYLGSESERFNARLTASDKALIERINNQSHLVYTKEEMDNK